ncbi:MAG: DUF1292 domain-containing protein [Oscillospiraceae bacterium]|nr:DUF1292 domain-containing protein [Oscillospiraceae bacterium]
MEDNIIILEDEAGNPVECEVIDVYDFNNNVYFAMIETTENAADEETDVIIMKLQKGESPDDDTLLMIEDEDELEAAFNEFVRRDNDDFE